MKFVKQTKAKALRPGEFRSRTQMPIGALTKSVLKVRAEGIRAVRKYLNESIVGNYSAFDVDSKEFEALRNLARQLIASMNFSVAECNKELKVRGNK